ncbi:VOC family protein [Rhizobium rhizophilum]|uniref:Glyoxalase n=1 Tax=Rhizobium rhizophilum TaxID=1850373 RepID=A0ABY2QWN4_9HYPH|nr:glyoxalase [Rhizobium rhizophilum]THV15496.1 glyoxalase [Rhizobium rhizophilum]
MNAQQPIATTILNAVPILPSLNFLETRNFYVENLGFEEVGLDCLDYLVVRRGGMELHFWLSDDPMQCQNSSVFFRATAPSEIYRDFCERGIEAIRPSDAEGEDIRFHVRDPHGNLLMFSGMGPAAVAH